MSLEKGPASLPAMYSSSACRCASINLARSRQRDSLRVGDGVEEQQVFLGDLLHLVFILSELPYLVEVFSIIHKGGEKICLNLSRHPDFCENFKKIAGFSEKQGKPRLFWQKISKRTEIFPAGTKLREKTGPPPADPSGIALQFSV